MKTRTKLIVGFAGVVILVVGASHFTGNLAVSFRKQFYVLEDEIFPSILRMNEIEREAGDVFGDTMEYTVTGSAGAKEAALSGTDHLTELGIAHFNQEAQIGGEEEENARELTQKIAAFGSAVNTIVRLKDQPTDGAVFAELERARLSPALQDLQESASQHRVYLLGKMAKAGEALREAETYSLRLFALVTVISALAAMVLAFFIARSIVRPLSALRKGVEIIGQGNLDYTVGTKAGDEIGQLSRAFDQMTQDLKKKTTSIDNLNREIAERQRAEEALQGSEEKYRAIFEQASDSIVLVDMATRGIVDFNDRAYQNLGYTRQEFAKLRLDDIDCLISDEDTRRRSDEIQEKGMITFETKHHTKNGEIRDVMVSSQDFSFYGKRFNMAVWHDITESKRAEEELRRERNRAQNYLDVAGVIIVAMDTEGEVTLINRKGCEVLGYKEEEIIGQNWLDRFIPPRIKEEMLSVSRKLLAGEIEPTEIYENPVLTRSGEERLIAWHNTALRDERGNIIGHLSSGEDVTERKQAADALQESEEKYRAIFERASDSIVLFDLDTTEILDFNDQAHQNLGYTREEFAKLKIRDIDATESGEVAEERKEKLLEKETISFEAKHRAKSGELRDFVVSVRALNYGGKKLALCLWHDITERKRAEEKYRTIIETTPDGFSLVEMNGRWLDVNDSYCRMLGYTRKETLRLSVPDIEAGESHQEIAEHLKRVKEQGHDRFESKYRRKDGSIIDVEISIKYLDVGGGLLFTFVHDITQRKKAEDEIKKALSDLEQSSAQLAAINQELEAFSYSVSHDLRAPLRTIDGFSQALLEDYQDSLDKEGQDYLQRVRSASQRMGTLIDDLLKLSRLSRSEMYREKVDLSALAEEAAAKLQQNEPKRKVEFVIGQGLTASGDRGLLRAALENLLGNAWKFTGKQPQAKIEVGMTRNGGKNTYYVRDNGAGFDMKYADKLFGAFQRLHDNTEFPGTGIGLATVQRIIHRHGGRTWAEGVMGKGATFYFTLN